MYLIPKILKKIKFSIIKHSHFEKDTAYESGSTIIDCTFGSHSYCGYNCKILHTDVGKYTSIADNVVIGISNHRMDLISTSPCFVSQKDSVKFKAFNAELTPAKKTIIGNDVWIGEGVKIKSGITIGDGSIIGMGSIVTKDIPSYAIVAGNPAKIIRYRFDDKTIKKLLEYKWWNLSDKVLKTNNGFDGNVFAFIDWYEKNNC